MHAEMKDMQKIFHIFIYLAYLPSDFCFLRILHRANDAIMPPAAILVAKYDVAIEGISLSREEIYYVV